MNAFAFLADAGLRAPERVDEWVASVGRDQLTELLNSYRDEVTGRIGADVARPLRLAVSPDSFAGRLPQRLVRQWALVADETHVQDPLLHARRELLALDVDPLWVTVSADTTERFEAFRPRLRTVLRNLYELRPLVEVGAVRLSQARALASELDPGVLTAEDFFGPSGTAPELTGGKDAVRLPEVLDAFAEEHIELRPGVLKGRGFVVQADQEFTDQNVVCVGIRGDESYSAYPHFQIVPPDPNDDSRIIQTFHDPTASVPVDDPSRQVWVESSIRKYLRLRAGLLAADLAYAEAFKTQFMTPLPGSVKLAQAVSGVERNRQDPAPDLANLLSLKLPYFDSVTAADIARAREDLDSFYNFRSWLQQVVRRYEAEGSAARPADLEVEAAERLEELDATVREYRASHLVESVVMFGALGVTVASGGNPLAGLGAMGLTVGVYDRMKSREREKRRHPLYFYWKTVRG